MTDRSTERGVLAALTVAALVVSGCGEPESSSEIDPRSYALGGIGAFSEMVAAGVKQLALSSPLPPAEMDALIDDAVEIAAANGAQIYREADFLVTDLFPAELTEGKHVLLIYVGSTRREYMDLKEDKARLIESGSYEGEARLDVARRFGAMLSYSTEKIDALLASTR